jgi:hypothetical protein
MCGERLSHNHGIFSETLLVVTDWQLLLFSAVGESLIIASVYGLLLYGAYKVCGYFDMTVFFLDIFEFFNPAIHSVGESVQIRIPRLHVH